MMPRLISRRCSPRRLLFVILLVFAIYAMAFTGLIFKQSPNSKSSYNVYSQIDVDIDDLGFRHGVNPGNVLIHDKYMQMKRKHERLERHNLPNEDWKVEVLKNEEKVKPTPPIAVEDESQNDRSKEGGSMNYPEPSYNLHAFYYPWYGNSGFDGAYLHWNHEFLSHWNNNEAHRWPKGKHVPPDDIGSNFYPELGTYSSRDPKVIANHMEQLRSAGIGTIAVSWYPANQADEQGKSWDDLMPTLLDLAHSYKVKVCFHIEPFKGRNEKTLRQAVMYIHDQYGSHPAYYRLKFRGKTLPLFYVYDSYLVRPDHWSKLLSSDGEITVRNSRYDAVFIGLLVEERHNSDLISAGFDGFYTYFASDGFSFGSSTRNWGNLANSARSKDMLFIPSIGPGYIDTQVRPWNSHNSRNREHGGYYEQSFRAALGCKAPIISITSFNEWHEGTQIERAVPKQTSKFTYLDYSPQKPDYYLSLTRKWALKLRKSKTKHV